MLHDAFIMTHFINLVLVLQGEWSLLHIAARRGRDKVAEVLINKLDVNIKDKVLVTYRNN